MEMRQFRDTNKQLSLLGLGCMRFPKVDPHKDDIDIEKAEEIIDYAYSHGINYFDTAYPYHGGQSEVVVGNALKKYPRESFNLATKMPFFKLETREQAISYFNEQLSKCNVKYFDFYLCHAMNKNRVILMKELGVYDYLQQMKKEGKIRYLGFSFHDTPDVLQMIVDEFEWDFAQIQLNYLDWELQDAKKQYEILTEKGIPVIVMEPVRGGTLASLCEESDSVLKNAAPNKSIASWALRYTMSLENVIVVLSGMSNMEQLTDNIQTASNFEPISKEEHTIIEKAVTTFMEKKTIPCTGCRYCMECPKGVDIPKMIKLYNNYAISVNRDFLLMAWDTCQASERADKCIACGACITQCPQSIQIPEKMKEISSLVLV